MQWDQLNTSKYHSFVSYLKLSIRKHVCDSGEEKAIRLDAAGSRCTASQRCGQADGIELAVSGLVYEGENNPPW